MKVRSGAPTTAEDSVESSGMSITVLGKVGLTVETAATRTAPVSPCFFAYSALVSTTAAAPSEVAQMSSRCSGSATIGLARTSSSVTSLR